jgi:cell division transport system permease protein
MAFGNILRESMRGVKRHRSAFLMSVAVQGICLLLFTLFAVITINLFSLLKTARDRVEVYAFIADDANPDDLSASLKLVAGIHDVRYVSKEEALVELKQDMGESAAIVDALGHNPLPASLRVKLAPGYTAPKNLNEVERKISIMPGVKEVWSGRELLTRLERIFQTALVLDIALLLIIGLAVVFIIFQSIESVIATRSKEIEIMRLVGASDAMIRGPFYWEGVLQGAVGGALAFVLSLILYQVALTQIPQPFFPIVGIVVFNIAFGGVLGYMGADVALSRFTKEG